MKLDIRNKVYNIDIHQSRSNFPFLILLHGFMGSGGVFNHLVADLKKFSNPVTINLLGHGDTEGDANPERFITGEQVKDLAHVVDHFNPRDVILHGYSMGGRLALQYALARPNTISRLILESTTYGISNQQKRQERQKLDKQRANAIVTDYVDFLKKWEQLSIFNSKIEVPAPLKNHYTQIQANQQPHQMANSLRGFGTGSMPSAVKKLDKLSIPALILAGKSDKKYCRIADEMQRQTQNSRAVIIENAGHRVHLENPEGFVCELKSFIKKVPGT